MDKHLSDIWQDQRILVCRFLILKSLEGKNLTCYEYFSISVLKHFGYTGIQKSSYTFTSNMVFNDYLWCFCCNIIFFSSSDFVQSIIDTHEQMMHYQFSVWNGRTLERALGLEWKVSVMFHFHIVSAQFKTSYDHTIIQTFSSSLLRYFGCDLCYCQQNDIYSYFDNGSYKWVLALTSSLIRFSLKGSDTYRPEL